jgi:hypothetical protein
MIFLGGGKEEPGEILFLIVFALQEMAYFEMDDDFNKRFILYNNAFPIFYTDIGNCRTGLTNDFAVVSKYSSI